MNRYFLQIIVRTNTKIRQHFFGGGAFPMFQRNIRFLFCSVVCLLTTMAWSQVSTSRITGVVSDKSGAVIPGANVTITNEGTNNTYHATSGAGGVYVVDSLQVGTYTVAIDANGFKKYVSKGNVLSVGVPTTVNALLELGSTGDTVEVKGGY